MMGLTNNWIIVSIIMPGSAFYASFRVIAALLNIHNSFFTEIDSNVIFTSAIVVGCGMIIQLFGMTVERGTFALWNFSAYKKFSMKDVDCQDDSKYSFGKRETYCKHMHWQHRYDIMTLHFDENETIERIIAQLFMAHNLAIGLTIQTIWLVWHQMKPHLSTSPLDYTVLIVLIIITAFSYLVSYMRFRTGVNSLYAFAVCKKIPCCRKKKDPREDLGCIENNQKSDLDTLKK